MAKESGPVPGDLHLELQWRLDRKFLVAPAACPGTEQEEIELIVQRAGDANQRGYDVVVSTGKETDFVVMEEVGGRIWDQLDRWVYRVGPVNVVLALKHRDEVWWTSNGDANEDEVVYNAEEVGILGERGTVARGVND
jgi:hypothetical protein